MDKDAPVAKDTPQSTVTVADAAPAKSGNLRDGIVLAKADLPATSTVAPVVTQDAPAILAAPKPARSAKADFKPAQMPYQAPDSLKVTFNDGTQSRFDASTWSKACEQIGKTGDFCAELQLNKV